MDDVLCDMFEAESEDDQDTEVEPEQYTDISQETHLSSVTCRPERRQVTVNMQTDVRYCSDLPFSI